MRMKKMPDEKFIWYKHKVAGPFKEITEDWIERWKDIVDTGKASQVPNVEPLNEAMKNEPNIPHIFLKDPKEGNTILSELIGVPPRLDGLELEEEYIERVILEYSEEIYHAVKFDIAMGSVDWKIAGQDMTVEEFAVGWTKTYAENIVEALGFEEIPIME
jgi:hypothetical protein